MTTTPSSQICLPGQTHVAEGPHDQTAMYLMHHAFRRDLAAFESAVRNTPLHDHAVWRALAARWEAFSEVLHHHHGVEDDLVWPVMLRRADELGEEEARATLEAMEAEHELIDPALAACSRGFASMVTHPCADHRNQLDADVTTTRAALLDHLRHEETEALPLLQRILRVEDTADTEKQAMKRYSLRFIPFLVPWALSGVPQEAVDRILSIAGPGYGVVLRLFGGRFARRERRTFRYA